jgi:hypothetical protein
MFNAKIEVDGHILRVSNAILALQRKLDILIDSVINAQKGILQPQVISPVNLIANLLKGMPAFPKDTILPVSLSKDSAHLLTRICELQVYVKHSLLGYVSLLPLVNRGNFNIYRLISIPVPLDRSKFLYIDTGRALLWTDQARQYYFLANKEELEASIMVDTRLYVDYFAGISNVPKMFSDIYPKPKI